MEVATILRPPNAKDGMSVHELIAACPPLDTNSSYCNLLQCSHFSNTSVIAEEDGETLGFISGYLTPDKKNHLFIWQVAVSDKARGKGLAGKMLKHILQRDYCREVTHIETTITKDNKASWALFESLAKQLGTQITRSVIFEKEQHFNGAHDTEMLALIGPF